MASRSRTRFDSSSRDHRLAAVMAAEAQTRLLANGAVAEAGAPKSVTGCLSSLSTCAAPDQDYAAALKNYGEVYERFQEYLAPADAPADHNYDQVIAMSMPQGVHLGCLNDAIAAFPASIDTSDDDVEGCGYLGWLHH